MGQDIESLRLDRRAGFEGSPTLQRVSYRNSYAYSQQRHALIYPEPQELLHAESATVP